MTIQIWSTARIEQLKTSWHAGLSASQIATALGSVTRNAVIGKLHRLGLTEDKRTTTSSSSRNRKPRLTPSQPMPARQLPSAPRISTPRPISRRATQGFHPLSQRNTATAVAFDLALEQHSIPANQRLSLSQLTSDTCHWPVGDPGTPDFFFCGGAALSKQPYCAHHARLAYLPATSKTPQSITNKPFTTRTTPRLNTTTLKTAP